MRTRIVTMMIAMVMFLGLSISSADAQPRRGHGKHYRPHRGHAHGHHKHYNKHHRYARYPAHRRAYAPRNVVVPAPRPPRAVYVPVPPRPPLPPHPLHPRVRRW